jgi:hypothetical protein
MMATKRRVYSYDGAGSRREGPLGMSQWTRESDGQHLRDFETTRATQEMFEAVFSSLRNHIDSGVRSGERPINHGDRVAEGSSLTRKAGSDMSKTPP